MNALLFCRTPLRCRHGTGVSKASVLEPAIGIRRSCAGSPKCWRPQRHMCGGPLLSTPAAVTAERTFQETSGEVENPYGRVEDVMTETGLKATGDEAMLNSILDSFDRVSGLPVVDSENKVLGVITRKDIVDAKRKNLNLATTHVRECYTSPAVTVRPHAHIAEAAGLMLAHKLHRLPVVDAHSRLLGIVSRSDVMQPLLQHHGIYDIARSHPEEPHSLRHELDQLDFEGSTWQVQYLYDGNCSMCRTLKNILQRKDAGRGKILFVNIADHSYNPKAHADIAYEDAMDTMHIIRRNGDIITGVAALRELYAVAGMGWAAKLGSFPVISNVVDLVYGLLSKYRLGLGGMDAVQAMRRLRLAEEGIEHCADNGEECSEPQL